MLQRFITLALVMHLTPVPGTAIAADIDTGAVRLIEVATDVYAVLPGFAGANGALILRESGHIVVDTHGTPASARALINAAGSISDQPIRYVVNTHWHVDHHTGNAAYKAAYGDDVLIISHDETRREIPTLGAEQFAQVAAYRAMPVQAADDALADAANAHGEPLDAAQIAAIETFRDEQQAFAAIDEYRYTLADLTFSDSISLHGDAGPVEVFFLHPAHTRSDAIVYVPHAKVLIVGDLLTQPILWTWSSHPASYIETLRALEALPAEKILIGHGGPVLEDKAYLVQVREFLEAAVLHATSSMAAGLDEEAAIDAAMDNAAIAAFRRRFVTEAQDGMFDQMVSWTVARAYLE